MSILGFLPRWARRPGEERALAHAARPRLKPSSRSIFVGGDAVPA